MADTSLSILWFCSGSYNTIWQALVMLFLFEREVESCLRGKERVGCWKVNKVLGACLEDV